MSTILISLSLALIFGLVMSRAAKLFNLPAVTSYLIGGLLLGPYAIGAFGIPGIGFNSLEDLNGLAIVTQVALGFIAFLIGNEFRVKDLKVMGRQAIIVGIAQAVPGMFLYKGIYYLGLNDITNGSIWLTKALLIISALPLGLITARIITDRNFRKSS